MKGIFVELFKSKDGWRWRLKSAGNRKIGATSEAYVSYRRCHAMAMTWLGDMGFAVRVRKADAASVGE